MLSINNVYKTFNSISILTDINLNIEKDHIIGLAGPSGSGKSTLLRCIQGLDQPDTGEIKRSGTTGFMFQDFQLFPHMSVLRNLTYAPNLITKNYKENQDRALELLKQLGIEGKENHYPSQLSGGQKQRVALARSLMMRPDLLLCDEPTSGLDVATIREVVQLLFSIQALGVTMIIASHDLDFLTQIAERIILLKQGQIVADVKSKENGDIISYLKDFY